LKIVRVEKRLITNDVAEAQKDMIERAYQEKLSQVQMNKTEFAQYQTYLEPIQAGMLFYRSDSFV
jgi:hypothetical protein